MKVMVQVGFHSFLWLMAPMELEEEMRDILEHVDLLVLPLDYNRETLKADKLESVQNLGVVPSLAAKLLRPCSRAVVSLAVLIFV